MTKSDNKGIVFRCLFAFILFLTASFIFFKTDSYAASFTHKHTDACYNEVQAYAKHTLRNLYEDTTAHCGNCGCQRTFRVSSWTENCSGPCGSRYAGCTISCTVCGHINHKDRIDQPSGHYYTTRGLVCGKDETSSTAATVTLAPITITPTNTSVVIDAAVAVEDPNFALADAPYDFGNGYGSSSTFEVTENGTYTVNVMDNLVQRF